MRLTAFTDVGLRILIRLAVVDDGQRISTRDIAREMHVSYTHATKACAHLAAQGWIDAGRGRGGGVCLTAAGRGALLGDVLRSLEGDDEELVDCDGLDCPLRSSCRLRAALVTAGDAFYASLNTSTVAELASPPTRAVILELTTR